jgi:rhamnulokinase
MVQTGTVAAIDLGATSGRVMLGHVSAHDVRLQHVLRFANGPVQQADGLHWDIDGLYRSILAGLRTALHEEPDIRSIGVDAWAVDYALLRDGRTLGAPFHYRDDRNLAAVTRSSLRPSCMREMDFNFSRSTRSTNSPPIAPQDASPTPSGFCSSPT